VSSATGIMGGDSNTVHLIKRDGTDASVDSWPAMTKTDVAATLITRIAEYTGKA
jgi:phosphopantothenoylcysteine decarboxylase/phosphopantothenate--cysteine ligase